MSKSEILNKSKLKSMETEDYRKFLKGKYYKKNIVTRPGLLVSLEKHFPLQRDHSVPSPN